MDLNIADFFDSAKRTMHNCTSSDIPKNFSSWESDDSICKMYFDWIRERSQCNSLLLLTNSQITKVKEEILSRIFLAKPHRENESNNWKCIVLHGISSVMSDSAEYYRNLGINVAESYKWTDVATYFPETVAWVKENIPFDNFGRVRIMVLDPGGYVVPHVDYPNGQMLAGINIAVTNPTGSEFVLDNGGLIPWQEGESRLVDIGKMHSIRNVGTEPRVHMIVHPEPLTEWNLKSMQLVCRSYDEFKGKT